LLCPHGSFFILEMPLRKKENHQLRFSKPTLPSVWRDLQPHSSRSFCISYVRALPTLHFPPGCLFCILPHPVSNSNLVFCIEEGNSCSSRYGAVSRCPMCATRQRSFFMAVFRLRVKMVLPPRPTPPPNPPPASELPTPPPPFYSGKDLLLFLFHRAAFAFSTSSRVP